MAVESQITQTSAGSEPNAIHVNVQPPVSSCRTNIAQDVEDTGQDGQQVKHATSTPNGESRRRRRQRALALEPWGSYHRDWSLSSRGAAVTWLDCQAASLRALACPYPLVIAVDDQQRAEVNIERSLGHVPVTFTGLDRPRDPRIRVNGQAVTLWQTDWNPLTRHWQITCNVAAPDAGNLHLQFQTAPQR